MLFPKQMALTLFFLLVHVSGFFLSFVLTPASRKVTFAEELEEKSKWSSGGQQKDFLQLNSITGNDWNEYKTALLEC